jgi:hypothetical protein
MTDLGLERIAGREPARWRGVESEAVDEARNCGHGGGVVHDVRVGGEVLNVWGDSAGVTMLEIIAVWSAGPDSAIFTV